MKKQDLLIILVPTFICVLAWIGFNIYHNFVTSTISPADISQITPINPDFDTKTISQLKQRERVEPLFQATPSSVILPTPTPVILKPLVVIPNNSIATTGGQIIK
jgi:hypothetical protein